MVSVAGGYYVQAAAALGASAGTWLPARSAAVRALALGLPIGALTTNILIIDDIRDREFDAVKGKRTLAVRFGARWSRAEFAVAARRWRISRRSGSGWGSGCGAWVLLPLAHAFRTRCRRRATCSRCERYQDLVPVTPKAGRLLLAYSVLLGAGAGLP